MGVDGRGAHDFVPRRAGGKGWVGADVERLVEQGAELGRVDAATRLLLDGSAGAGEPRLAAVDVGGHVSAGIVLRLTAAMGASQIAVACSQGKVAPTERRPLRPTAARDVVR